MARKIHSISLSEEQSTFLEEQNISPSNIIQQKIEELMQMSRITGEQFKEANRKAEAWRKIAEEARVFIEKKGLLDEWLAERGA